MDTVKNLERLLSEQDLSGLTRSPDSPVRTTFTLSPDSDERLKALSQNLGISEKEILDTAVDLLASRIDGTFRSKILNLARQASATQVGSERRRKSRVLSKSTVVALNDLARKSDVARDALLDIVIAFAEQVWEYTAKINRKGYAEMKEAIEKFRVLADELEAFLKQKAQEVPFSPNYPIGSLAGVLDDWESEIDERENRM